MKQFGFLEWTVYRDAQRLFSEILKVSQTLPPNIKYEVGSQLIRSSLSIVLNIAEGSGKESKKELVRFLEIALGSAHETLACLDTLRHIERLDQKEFEFLRVTISEICRQIGGLKRSVRKP